MNKHSILIFFAIIFSAGALFISGTVYVKVYRLQNKSAYNFAVGDSVVVFYDKRQ